MVLRRAAPAIAAICAAAAGIQSCSSTTEVIVVIDGDVRDVDNVVVQIESGGVRREKRADLAETRLPLTMGVNAGGDDRASFTVTATARRGTTDVVSRTLRARLVPGETRMLVVPLCAACASSSCSDPADEAPLETWTGAPPRDDRCSAISGPSDAGADAPDGSDPGPIVVLPGGYHLVDDARNWQSIDLATAIAPRLVGYLGAAISGGYVYFAPYRNGSDAPHGHVVRFETSKPFGEAASWQTFDLTTLDTNARGYAGAATFAAYQGFPDFVYFVPYGTSSGDRVARYRTDGAFEAKTSWGTIATETVAANAAGFGGAVVNESHVWLPTRTPTRPFALHSLRNVENPTRLMTVGWESVDPRAVDAGSSVVGGYFGGAYDPVTQRMYFAPAVANMIPHGIALMRVIGGGATTGWSAFDLGANIDGKLRGYAGGVFDGRYVYFVPHKNEDASHGNVVRYDTTTSSFTATASWERFDLATIDPRLVGFLGGVFDGRFITFVPNVHGIVARYDTTKPFGEASSWSRFDLRLAGAGATPLYAGGAFDGRYVYLVPAGRAPALRFEARDSADLGVLEKSHGSFL